MPQAEFVYGAPASGGWPAWLPDDIRHYLTHVERGAPLRELARRAGCHPSTILRQVRRVESRRDDPLIDAALRTFGEGEREVKSADGRAPQPETCDEETLQREGVRILRRLCEAGAVLAVVPDMEKAVVVRETPSGTTQRIAVVDTAVAQAMALKDWIACKRPGRIARYDITTLGRTALGKMMAQAEQARGAETLGLAEAQSPFVVEGANSNDPAPRRRVRYGLSETPLTVLGRRRGTDGKPFLTADLVAAGERLREDFELAQMGPKVTQDWSRFLTGPSQSAPGDALSGSSAARQRLEGALHDLGPGLGDVALRCCCYLEGLETAEQELGWAARSGKVVLRIALQRLKRYYDQRGGAGGDLIG